MKDSTGYRLLALTWLLLSFFVDDAARVGAFLTAAVVCLSTASILRALDK